MPLINLSGGERIPRAFRVFGAPVMRIPVWALVGWWLTKGLWRLTVFAVRGWRITLPIGVGWWAATTVDPLTAMVAALVLAAVGVGWWRLHRASFTRLVGYPLLAWWRRLWCYRRRWRAAMVTCGLAVYFAGDRYT